MELADYEASHVYKVDFGATPAEPHIHDMPAASYVALAIGPDSEHDMMLVKLPGFSATLSKGTVLPLPKSTGPMLIKLHTKRPFDGRVQVIGCETWQEATAVATGSYRAPYIEDSGHIILSLATETIIRPYCGRNTALMVFQNALPAVPDVTIETFGRIVRDGFGDAGSAQFCDVPLNVPPWGTDRLFAWAESEPCFEFIRYDITNNDIINPDVAIWTRYEARD